MKAVFNNLKDPLAALQTNHMPTAIKIQVTLRKRSRMKESNSMLEESQMFVATQKRHSELFGGNAV